MLFVSRRLIVGAAFVQALFAVVYAKPASDLASIIDDQDEQEKALALALNKEVKKPVVVKITKEVKSSDEPASSAGTKNKISVKNGDSVLTIGGKMKIEHAVDKNTAMFNSNLPDTLEFFKHCVDLNFDYAYGKEKFGYNAAEAFVELRHKGVWGKSMSFADRDAGGAGAPSIVVLDGVSIGGHSHETGRTLLWVKEAWLQISPNAVLNATSDEYLHQVKIGWVPFELGRGIALGGFYGVNKQLLGLYSYTDDKATPGILLHGQLIKDKLSYDLYYSKIEERGKSLSGNIAPIRKHELAAKAPYWRGDDKDNELFAGRLQGIAFDNECCGKLNLEPYIFYNIANDQWIDMSPDTDTRLGAFGLNLEHAYKNFEWGGEVAFNFGEEKLHAIDKNVIKYKKDPADGTIKAYYSHISTDDKGKAQSPVTTAASTFAATPYAAGTNDNENSSTGFYNYNKNDWRFRDAYTNKFRGWMGVIDGAYNLKEQNLKVALAYAYASGDVHPHEQEVDKTYKGFVGLDELYSGKRVPSVFLLDQRLPARPLSLTENSAGYAEFVGKQLYKLVDIENDVSFTDLHCLGGGTTWTPTAAGKKFTINPNLLFFWRASDSKKVILDADNNVNPSADDASKFMGTELNTIIKCELLKDLTMSGNFAVFMPGQYYKDVAGIPLDGDLYSNLGQALQGTFDYKQFGLSYDPAYHMNIGLEYKF